MDEEDFGEILFEHFINILEGLECHVKIPFFYILSAQRQVMGTAYLKATCLSIL